MMLLGQTRDAEIAKLGLSPEVLQLTTGQSSIGALRGWCGPLYYCLQPEQFEPDNMSFIPLWESESTITGFYWNGNIPIFIRYPAEDFNAFKTLGTNIDAVLLDLIENFLEPSEREDVERMLSSSRGESKRQK